ncbi:MAG: NfeD family protein [Firmicutes bacterium]|jgi:membrane protein implicated in regulation of membrane protease activity|nr:NfeD family protein [Bacillota bacterium]
MDNTFVLIWLGIAIAFGIGELMTFGLTSIWYAIGALAAMFAALIHLPAIVQVVVFLVVTIILLYFTKPIALKYLKIGSVKTNIQELYGKEGIVTKEISEHSYGQVKVDGKIWTAKSLSNETIEKDTLITVNDIEGVKLIVSKSIK